MTEAHKAALAEGREQGRVVRRYLQALEAGRSRRRRAGPDPAFEAFEADFVAVAQAYSRRKGITWAAWREVGVPRRVLEAAGIERG